VSEGRLPSRSRVVYGLATAGVIGLGLASRRWPGLFAAAFGKYPGDALWALMVFLLWGMFRPSLATKRLAAYALITAYLDEFSQIYQASWIDAIRATTVGHLLLGSTFSWWDMFAYTAGVGVGVVCENVALRLLFQNPG
jgi:hypothetical protein